MALPSVEMATSERNAVLDGVLGIFSRILKVPPSRIVPDASLAENGIDSLALFDVFETDQGDVRRRRRGGDRRRCIGSAGPQPPGNRRTAAGAVALCR
ncbi:acyl carrier protein (plasmid) [Azospirillum argentinense]|uniref:Acyl carrier protein n=1 Tax=Azospirillum argentinense TaxID=2970906 RepID=A0A4D8PXW3_9PROT|nr:acyl carrier protein [Azospirillum argentinense]